jgi:dTDP-4-dehydrorhamnose reductase
VDKAESEPELAMRINGFAPGVLAEEAKRLGALLVHYSTDYVFDSEKATPYVEDDLPNPINLYGRTKLEGERAIQAAGCRHLTLRTSWVYGARSKNFLLTILRLAKEKTESRIVDDQVGAPTWCRALADISVAIIAEAWREAIADCLYHATNAGHTTWFGFAKDAFRLAGLETPIRPIPTTAYPTPAARPVNSVLNNGRLHENFRISPPEWQTSVAA